MTTQSEAIMAPPALAPPALPATRPFYWSVRRELWENRWIYVVPMVVASVVLLGSLVAAVVVESGSRSGAINLSLGLTALSALDRAQQAAELAEPFGVAAFPITVAGFILAVFYCLGALHNERRDRSILFWKSLPVSDFTTVLSKASIPLLVLPALLAATIIATRLLLLLLGTLVLLANGQDAAILWANFPLLQLSLVPVYGVTVEALWYAPIYGWLLLVSSWARRAPFLWAVLPPLGLVVFENIAFHTSHFQSLLGYRLTGSDSIAYAGKTGSDVVIYRLDQFDPVKFLSSPGLWSGLAFAAACLAAAAWLRRRREPI